MWTRETPLKEKLSLRGGDAPKRAAVKHEAGQHAQASGKGDVEMGAK